MTGVCGRCGSEGDVFAADCACDPVNCDGAPGMFHCPECGAGMFHCPDCGAMCLALLPHPALCRLCLERRHPDYDDPVP